MPTANSFKRCDLTLFATSDLHLQLCPWDYYANVAAPGTGLAAVSGTIARMRAACSNSLLIDNGDFLQGSALGDALMATRDHKDPRPHPMIAAMNLAGVDAVSLGNHDFDYGLGALSQALAQAEFPALCANISPLGRTAVPFAGWTILHRTLTARDGTARKIRIGLFGVTPPQVMIWNEPKLAGRLTSRGMIPAAAEAVAALRRAGADLVIGLCHSGIGRPDAGEDDENATLAIAALPGVDAVVAGHTHDVFPSPEFRDLPGVDTRRGTLAGKPACMPGFGASHIGLLHLELGYDREGQWHLLRGRGEARALIAPTPLRREARMSFTEACAASPGLSPEFSGLCQEAHTATVAHLNRSIGASHDPLTSYFAMTGDCPVTGLVTDAMLWYLRSRLPQGELKHARLLAAASPWRAGGRRGPQHYTYLTPGPVFARDIAALCPFPDELRALRITGADLLAWLEHSARAFNTISPGSQDTALLADSWASYNFDVIHGVSYQIDLSVNENRIRNLCSNGVPVAPDDLFILATTSYRAAGGGGFPATGPGGVLLLDTALTLGQIVEEFLGRTGPYQSGSGRAWSFLPIAGATALFETSPCASRMLPRQGFESAGITAGGFLQLRLQMEDLCPLHPAQ